MENLSKVAMVQVTPGAILPCMDVNIGVFTAVTTYRTPFSILVRFGFVSGGVRQQVETVLDISTGTIDTTMPPIEFSVYLDFAGIPIRTQPDSGTTILATAQTRITDANGNIIACSPVSRESFTAP
jgi:hypothetical protein